MKKMNKHFHSGLAVKMLQTLMVSAVIFSSAPCFGKCYEPVMPEKLRK